MRKLLFNVHLYLALVTAIFVLILGVTGSIMAFESELDRWSHSKLVYVTPGSRTLSLEEIRASVAKAFPDERILGYGIASSPDLSHQVALRGKTVFMNPYSGDVLGVRSGPDAVAAFLGAVHQLHLRLLIRNRADSGKTIMSWVGVVMLIVLPSGIYLWWPQKRVSVRFNGPSRRFWFDVHNTTGVFSFVFLLMLTITGVVIGFDDAMIPMFYKMSGSQPSRPPNIKITPPPGATPITLDRAVEIARAALPGALPYFLSVPIPTGTYSIRARYPEDLTPGGRSTIIVDQYSGKVLFAEGSRTAPVGRRMEIVNRAIHTGDIFGAPSKIVMSLASLMAAVQVVSGVAMWWARRSK
jgi:uncharacterized iron-regulated membrane protein